MRRANVEEFRTDCAVGFANATSIGAVGLPAIGNPDWATPGQPYTNTGMSLAGASGDSAGVTVYVQAVVGRFPPIATDHRATAGGAVTLGGPRG